MSVETTFIYALRDPGTKKVRYVGKSNNPGGRAKKHYYEGVGSKKMRWMDSLKERGLRPELIVLEECPRDNYRSAETAWIHFFLDLGCNLTNAIYKGYDRVQMLSDAKYV